ncbi:mechanosensitive ion channel family protein [Lederbergia lenta]|uniref:Mechanosensitive ion channel MscS n=1 Tax=Lederbergia lenta TaxID=1467 RepID=A0A2X4ZGD7_LEDLE|nr:mechanosensitive ion channel family protein [Lederbergia lenta]MCM3112776.1 mechanosensitive ion channel family protein [Lederbergia lenta]MEC2326257.1 mechanosensitive ion channel family protein [Lederbergia lenta]SQI63755.1 mechanosensitive ion channel MscS [Lederbergia lenta]
MDKNVKEAASTFGDKLFDQKMWIELGSTGLKIILIFVIASVVIKVGKAAVGNMLKIKTKSRLRISERRENTLVKLLQNIITYSIYFIAFVTILSTVGIDIKGILAGAGILGVAVGFGSQNLVKDVIAGFFVIFEDQFSVGDEVKINSFEGKVEEIGLRTTKVLNWTGELYIIPNGSITEVTNYSIYNSTAVVDFTINYEGDLDKVERAIELLLTTLPKKYEEIIDTPKLLGIEQFNGEEVVFRITAETIPLKNWYIARQIRRELKVELDRQLPEIKNTESHQEE